VSNRYKYTDPDEAQAALDRWYRTMTRITVAMICGSVLLDIAALKFG
jgi:hypothetical protein